MPKVTIEVPEGFEEVVKQLEQTLQRAQKGVEGAQAGDMGAFDAAWQGVNAGVEESERQLKRRLLRVLDVDASQVHIDGKLYSRVGRYEASYKTRQGPVEVERSLYREVGVRNGPTVDPVSLRAGVVEDGWLPEAAAAMAHLMACGTSREADSTAQALGRLPYSRSSFERVGHAVGAVYGSQRPRVEEALVQALEVPAEAQSVSVSLDRVSVPMEEPRKRAQGRPPEGAPKRPVTRAFRMAYVGTLTLHDKEGQALKTLRYGRMPQADATQLAQRMAQDVQAVLGQRFLPVVVLTDGAPEMMNLLDQALTAHAPKATQVVPLVDFWHLMEKLGLAAVLLHGVLAPQVLERWKLSLLNRPGAVWQVLTELHESGKQHQKSGEAMPVHDAITYLENHGGRMGYAPARQRGLPIGSGTVEAACKSLVALRMKRPGSRWKEPSGQHILDLRALVLSDRWQPAMQLTLAPLRSLVHAAA
jgi:hypothetical protein